MSLIPGQKLVVATHNKGKLREIAELVEPFDFDVVSAGELGLDEPEEDGDSFVENALIKSRAAAKASGLPSLADDSGLCVWALANLPGIYSARWAGEDKDFSLAMKRVYQELLERGIDLSKPFVGTEIEEIRQRGAFFVSALALSLPDGTDQTFEGVIEGNLTWPPRGNRGFGYDPIFIPEAHDETFAEMNPEEKYAISHRTRAFIKFRAAILEA